MERLSFMTHFKIEFLLPFKGLRRVLKNVWVWCIYDTIMPSQWRRITNWRNCNNIPPLKKLKNKNFKQAKWKDQTKQLYEAL